MPIIDIQGQVITFDGEHAANVISCNVSAAKHLIDVTPLTATVIGLITPASRVFCLRPSNRSPCFTMYGM